MLGRYAGTSQETLKKVVLMVMDEFRQLCNDTVQDEELRRAKDHLKGSLALSLEFDLSPHVQPRATGTFFRPLPKRG